MAGKSFFTGRDDVADVRAGDGGSSLRFVVLHHTGFGRDHWDWFFEESHALAAWRVYHDPSGPSKDPLSLFRADDHRKFYLEHEGAVSGGRGEVRRVAAGRYDLSDKKSQRWLGRLIDTPWAGPFELRQIDGDRWELCGLLWGPSSEGT